MRYTVTLGCRCRGSRGWTVEQQAASERQAVTVAVAAATTCCRCGEVHGECAGETAARTDDPEKAVNIDISTTDAPATLDEQGGVCYSDYDVAVCLNGQRLGTIACWRVCGWLAPGAHADLDGSGLAVWGAAQRGGWRAVDCDGTYCGLPQVAPHLGGLDEPVSIGAGAGEGIEITPQHVPAWAAALAAVRAADDALTVAQEASEAADHALAVACPDVEVSECPVVPEGAEDLLAAAGDAEAAVEAADDALTEAQQAVEAVREAVVAAAEAACQAFTPPAVPEPDAEDVYRALPRCWTDPRRHQPYVCIGDYLGAGPCLAWRDQDGDAEFAWHPDSDDIARCARETRLTTEQQQELAGYVERLLDPTN